MKKSLISVFILAMTQIGFSQTVFENFDQPLEEKGYIVVNPIVTPGSQITLFQDTENAYEGAAALGVDYSIPAVNDWGGNAVFHFINPDTNTGFWDFSDYWELSFALNNKTPSSQPSRVQLQVTLFDISDSPHATKNMLEAEFWVSFFNVLDLEPGWNTFSVALQSVEEDDAENFQGSGFWHTNNVGIVGNDSLDLDKITGISFEFHMYPPQDSAIAEGTILLDNLVLGDKTTAIHDNHNQINPGSFRLEQNYPNPFNPVTRITYTVPATSNISLIVYDALGREIKSLVNEEKSPGNYTVQFDGTDLSSGIYFYVMKANNFIETKKLILLK
jgi:hypothetical protein